VILKESREHNSLHSLKAINPNAMTHSTLTRFDFISEDQVLGLSDDQLEGIAGGFLLIPHILAPLLSLLPEEVDQSGYL
jgi:hypothetical protein